MIDLFIAAFAACLCCWLIRSARHGAADNDDGRGDDATRLRVFGGGFGGFGGRPLGCTQLVRSCLDLAAWLVGFRGLDSLPGASCWWRPRCCGGGCASGNAVCSRYFVVVVVADVCGCWPEGR